MAAKFRPSSLASLSTLWPRPIPPHSPSYRDALLCNLPLPFTSSSDNTQNKQSAPSSFTFSTGSLDYELKSVQTRKGSFMSITSRSTFLSRTILINSAAISWLVDSISYFTRNKHRKIFSWYDSNIIHRCSWKSNVKGSYVRIVEAPIDRKVFFLDIPLGKNNLGLLNLLYSLQSYLKKLEKEVIDALPTPASSAPLACISEPFQHFPCLPSTPLLQICRASIVLSLPLAPADEEPSQPIILYSPPVDDIPVSASQYCEPLDCVPVSSTFLRLFNDLSVSKTPNKFGTLPLSSRGPSLYSLPSSPTIRLPLSPTLPLDYWSNISIFRLPILPFHLTSITLFHSKPDLISNFDHHLLPPSLPACAPSLVSLPACIPSSPPLNPDPTPSSSDSYSLPPISPVPFLDLDEDYPCLNSSISLEEENSFEDLNPEKVSDWILSHVGQASKYFGLNFDGIEKESANLFVDIEFRGRNLSHSLLNSKKLKLSRELKRLSSNINYESPTANGNSARRLLKRG